MTSLSLSEEIIINPNSLITRSGIEIATMGNELHNEEAMGGMFEGTGITAIYLDQEKNLY